MKPKSTNKQIKSAFIKYIDTIDLIALTEALKKIPVKHISSKNLARMENWNSQLQEIQCDIKETIHEIITDYKERPRTRPVIKVRMYKNNEDSFKKFQATRKQLTIKQFVRKFKTSMYRGYYDDIEAVLWYGDYYYFYVVKNGKQWHYETADEYGPSRPSKKKYVLLTNSNLAQSDDLEKMERALFKEVLRDKK